MPEDNADTEAEHMKELRAKAERAPQAEAELAAAKRELAFSKAGINTDSKPAQALLKTYEGEMTTEAITAEAAEWGIGKPAASEGEGEETPQQNYDPESPEAKHQALQDAEATGQPAPTPPPPEKTALEDATEGYMADRKAGTPRTDAEVDAFAKVLAGGARGDDPARFDPNAWRELQRQAGHGGNVAR